DWRELQRRLADNKAMSARANRYPDDFALRGLARCHCGASMHSIYRTNPDNVPIYRCGRNHNPPANPADRCPAPATIRAHILEAAVWSGFVSRLRSALGDEAP